MCDLDACTTTKSANAPAVSQARRRAFLKGIATLPISVILADPLLARAAGEKLQSVSTTLADGKTVNAFLAKPTTTPAPAVLLVHEWWGLNDHIKAMASEFANHGFLALAVDLYDGNVATTREDAKKYMSATDPGVATQTLTAWSTWLRNHADGNSKLGTVGWCFGGGWSLNASLATPVDATVIYYGNVDKEAAQLGTLKGPVMGHFGTLDQRINAQMVGGFQRSMAGAGKPAPIVHWYVAQHAFANPTGGRYDEEDAALAWARTLAFFHQHLS